MSTLTITDKEFELLAIYIKKHFGINLKEEKKALVVGRLQQVVLQLGFNSFTEYYNYVIHDTTGKASTTLINQITTNHTYFMREATHFDYLKDIALPQISREITDKDFRIWCAGCSSGEEAYTLAMILEDYFPRQLTTWDKTLLATDISTKALEKAVKGTYLNESLSTLPAMWRSKYLIKTNDFESTFTDTIKKEIVFRKYNLMSPILPFRKKFHIIFCRNVMIYFDSPTKQTLIQQFYEAIEPGGYLFIGHSESLERHQYGFQYVKPSVYRKPL